MHPYQDQVNRMWNLVKLRVRAIKQESWLEVIDLTYALLEMELRLLLTSKAGEQNKPLSRVEIDQQKYLMDLANLAKGSGFLDTSLWEKIREFNKKRADAIHGLAQGRISYLELKDVFENTTELIYNIQSLWLPISYGPEEKYEDYIKEQKDKKGN